MSEQIKFSGAHYEDVIRYLSSHKELRPGYPFGIDGKLYLTNSRKPSGFVLQRCCGDSDEATLSIINYHPSFNKIKQNLEKIINKNE